VERLADTPELLDGPLDDARTLEGNLRDLARINRLLGGVLVSRRALDALTSGPEAATLLDVGTGGADIPVALMAGWRRAGRRLSVTATDDRQAVLDAAVAIRPALARIGGLRLEVADGRRLPYPDRAFDLAHASLVLHHLEPADAVALLREMRRVATRGVIVNDVTRGRIAYASAWLLAHFATRNRFTRHDAPLSVQRAYTPAEMRDLLAQAGLRPVHEARFRLGARWAAAAVPA
jgi:ubiquinone/menaquinone biosynthesis C-methylase UbiE